MVGNCLAVINFGLGETSLSVKQPPNAHKSRMVVGVDFQCLAVLLFG